MMTTKHTRSQAGFALVFSVVIVAVVTVVTLALTSLTSKSIELSSAGQESQEAFYAADAGIECALYHDIQNREDNVFRDTGSPSGFINCNGQEWDYTCEDVDGEWTCRLNINFGGSEADVEIEIEDVSDAASDTTVEARGVNDDGNNPTERGLRVEY